MRNIDKIFEANPRSSSKIELIKGQAVFECYDRILSGLTIEKIINFVNTIHKKYKKINISIVFSFGYIKLADKLSYILFECICYELINNYHHRVYIYWTPQNDILTDGVFSCPLKLLNDKRPGNQALFIKKFEMEIYQHHFRRVIDGEEKENTNYLGKLLQELDYFLKYFDITEEYRDQIAEVIAELVGNACEHGASDCLLDIDITNDHLKSIKNIPQEGIFYGINIVIVNFSKTLLGDGIKNKIETHNLSTERYVQLGKAYNYHKQFFSNEYTYDDFCNIAALQDKISGRPHHNLAGGTGLTKLIHSLQEKSDMDSCYVLSGNRCVIFDRNLLNYDNQDWLGFNTNQDFLNSLPDEKAITDCYVFLPGTAYNLNFVMKREDNQNDENQFRIS